MQLNPENLKLNSCRTNEGCVKSMNSMLIRFHYVLLFLILLVEILPGQNSSNYNLNSSWANGLRQTLGVTNKHVFLSDRGYPDIVNRLSFSVGYASIKASEGRLHMYPSREDHYYADWAMREDGNCYAVLVNIKTWIQVVSATLYDSPKNT